MLHLPNRLTWPRTDVATQPPKVLLLDDSRAQRMLLRALLRRWGHDVVECATPEAALAAAADPEIGLVISDWVMPGLTGPEFCRRLRALNREGYVYVILLTSRSEDGALTEGLDAGADDFLTKPVRPPELRARLTAGERIVAMQRDLVQKTSFCRVLWASCARFTTRSTMIWTRRGGCNAPRCKSGFADLAMSMFRCGSRLRAISAAIWWVVSRSMIARWVCSGSMSRGMGWRRR
jgi:Response regulator containing a CheY-like receiver domain and a GGDEF domain